MKNTLLYCLVFNFQSLLSFCLIFLHLSWPSSTSLKLGIVCFCGRNYNDDEGEKPQVLKPLGNHKIQRPLICFLLLLLILLKTLTKLVLLLSLKKHDIQFVNKKVVKTFKIRAKTKDGPLVLNQFHDSRFFDYEILRICPLLYTVAHLSWIE